MLLFNFIFGLLWTIGIIVLVFYLLSEKNPLTAIRDALILLVLMALPIFGDYMYEKYRQPYLDSIKKEQQIEQILDMEQERQEDKKEKKNRKQAKVNEEKVD